MIEDLSRDQIVLIQVTLLFLAIILIINAHSTVGMVLVAFSIGLSIYATHKYGPWWRYNS